MRKDMAEAIDMVRPWDSLNDDDGFRVGLYIYDTDTPSPFWVVKGQYMIDGELGDDVWEFENFSIPVSEDDWFELEVYWYGHPNPSLGRIKVAIDGQILFDVTNQTKDPSQPDKIFYFMPFKVYGTVGYSWISDFEYWNIPPPSSILYDNQLSVKGETSLINWIISPNPANNVLYFSTDVLGMKYQIISAAGDVIKKGIINNQMTNIASLINGIYFVKVIDKETNIIHYTKLIKN